MTSRFPTPAEFASFPEPNYVNPITRQPLVVGVMVPLSVLVIVFMFCRLYSRTILVNAIGWDDWIMMLAGVSFDATILVLYTEVLTWTDRGGCE